MNEVENPPPLEIKPPEVYSVPRRFGIGTIMGVAAAYALLLWGMQQLDLPPIAIVANGIFLTLVGVMQVVMPRSPRWASALAGGVILFCVSIVDGILQQSFVFNPCMLLNTFVSGMIYGYCGGVLVAGVFLVIDRATRWFTHSHGSEHE